MIAVARPLVPMLVAVVRMLVAVVRMRAALVPMLVTIILRVIAVGTSIAAIAASEAQGGEGHQNCHGGFARVHMHPWSRGLNENTEGLFLPRMQGA
jgi:hypothetical protein